MLAPNDTSNFFENFHRPRVGRVVRVVEHELDARQARASLDGGLHTWGFTSIEHRIGPGFEAESNDAFGSRNIRRILRKSVTGKSGPPLTSKCCFFDGIMPASCASFNSV